MPLTTPRVGVDERETTPLVTEGLFAVVRNPILRGRRVTDVPGEAPVFLYDGACGFCNATVQFVLQHDFAGTLRFAALQSPWAKRVLARHPELDGIDSAMWVEPTQGRVLTRSAAGLQMASYLGGLWRLALVFWIVPTPIRDYVYDFIARHRHRLMGKAEQCLIPPPGARQRFLEE